MRIITAPHGLGTDLSRYITVFLAGGITNCRDWQSEVIDILYEHKSELDKLAILNPRRPDFPMDDPKAGEKQIKWEFNMLNRCDIFSMYFCNTEKSDQPICFYELGRNLAITPEDQVVISTEAGFRRELDVLMQTGLVYRGDDFKINGSNMDIPVHKFATPKTHAENIIKVYKYLLGNSKFL